MGQILEKHTIYDPQIRNYYSRQFRVIKGQENVDREAPSSRYQTFTFILQSTSNELQLRKYVGQICESIHQILQLSQNARFQIFLRNGSCPLVQVMKCMRLRYSQNLECLLYRSIRPLVRKRKSQITSPTGLKSSDLKLSHSSLLEGSISCSQGAESINQNLSINIISMNTQLKQFIQILNQISLRKVPYEINNLILLK